MLSKRAKGIRIAVSLDAKTSHVNKTVAIISIFFIIATVPSWAQEPIAFSFREYRVGDTEQQHKTTLQWCTSDRTLPVERSCFIRFKSLGLVAGNPLIFGKVGFSSNRLSLIRLTMATTSFEDVSYAFEEKYGKPCEVSAPTVRNGVGNTFTNDTKVWCFGDGKLTASRYGDKVTHMDVYFRNSEIVTFENVKPRVDF